MFRVPSNKNREQWIRAIERTQPFSRDKKNFNICIRHFVDSDFSEKKGDKFTLTPNAIPSVFNEFVEIISNEIIDESLSETTSCQQCPCLLEKIKNLEIQILLLKTKHSISIGRVEEKNVNLRKENVEKKNQLKISEKEKSKLKYYLDEIRSQNFISDAERDFLNVIIFMFTLPSIFQLSIFPSSVRSHYFYFLNT